MMIHLKGETHVRPITSAYTRTWFSFSFVEQALDSPKPRIQNLCKPHPPASTAATQAKAKMNILNAQLIPATHYEDLRFAGPGESSFMEGYSNDIRAGKGKDIAVGTATNNPISIVSIIVDYAIN
jgi:hypothetical protein